MSLSIPAKTEEIFPETTVEGLIFNDAGKIFLMKSDKWKGMYCIPGGHVEAGETLKDAVIREIKEETNLEVSDISFHSVQDCIFSENFHEKKHFVFVDFTCNAITDDVVLNDEGTEHIWMNVHKINDFPIEPYTLKTIQLYMNPGSNSKYIE